MSTYSLSGTGTQALNADVSELDITITARASPARDGQANPVNRYDQGLLRLGNAFGWYPAVPIDADNMVLAVPSGVTRLGYRNLFNGTISVAEVFRTTDNAGSPFQQIYWPMPDPLTPFSELAIGVPLAVSQPTRFSSGAATGANVAILIPFRVVTTVTYTRMFIANGTSTVAGTFDLGVYSSAYARLAHTGSTSQSGVGAVQNISIGTLTLTPGNYYLALSASGISTTIAGVTGATQHNRAMGMLEQSSSHPLPTSLTPTSLGSTGNVGMFGLTNRTTM